MNVREKKIEREAIGNRTCRAKMIWRGGKFRVARGKGELGRACQGEARKMG